MSIEEVINLHKEIEDRLKRIERMLGIATKWIEEEEANKRKGISEDDKRAVEEIEGEK